MSEVRPLRHNLGFLLALSNARVIRAVNRALVGHGLHARTYSVLALVCESEHGPGDDGEEGVSQRALAERLDLDPSQIVALVDALQSKGMVDRLVGRTDRRKRAIVATPRGREHYRKAVRTVMDVEDAVLEHVDAQQREVLLALLTELSRSR